MLGRARGQELERRQEVGRGRRVPPVVVIVWTMADITVEAQQDGTFEVEVRANRGLTNHRVSVPEGLARSLGCEHLETEELVRISFEFLLEREPPSSILRRFSLEVIGDYFPEYRGEMRSRCAEAGG